jgi:hypothetical protein
MLMSERVVVRIRNDEIRIHGGGGGRLSFWKEWRLIAQGQRQQLFLVLCLGGNMTKLGRTKPRLFSCGGGEGGAPSTMSP